MYNSPLVLALDRKEIKTCLSLIEMTQDYIGVYKLGLEFFTSNGPDGIKEIKRKFPQLRIFLDLKLHDIPNTVSGAASSLANLNLDFLTVHAAGASEMIEAAARALPFCKITAVTVLTSLDAETVSSLGISGSIEERVLNWAQMAIASGARAIVASPLEVAALRSVIPKEVTIITPGIRLSASHDDQVRTMDPKAAVAAGADLLVVGRPITNAANPQKAAKELYDSLPQSS